MAAVAVKNLVNGVFQDALSGRVIESLDPSTGRVFALLPDSEEADANVAVAAAKAAFKSWSNTTPQHRSALLLKLAALVEERLDEFALAESHDAGKTATMAKNVDIPRVVHNLRFFATEIHHLVTKSSVLPAAGALNYTTRRPVGPCVLISPWNLSLYLLTFKLAPALAFGNTVVCKPSELTSVTAFKLSQLLAEAGFPPGVVNFVFGYGKSVGDSLVRHPDAPLISFTGGTVTGKHVATTAAPLFKKVSLELGGKNPTIVFADCDFANTVSECVRSSFSNQGQICLCGSRILVQKEIYDRFVKEYVAKVSALVVGDPRSSETNVGALVSEAHMNKVLSYIELARSLGGKIECGGDRVKLPGDFANGFFVAPTVITGLSNDSRVCQEEIFGPVVNVIPFGTEEDAIEMANNIPYGLSASVWSSDFGRMHRVAEQLEVGTVWLNCWLVRDLNMPFGGSKQSGIGREGADDSWDFFTEQKCVCVKYK